MAQTLAYLSQQLLNTVQLISFYLPLALAFAVMQAITRRIFLSFGDIAMFASFAAVYVCFDSMLRGEMDLVSALVSLAAAMACGAALGAVIARLVLGQSLLKHPLAFMIASIGVAIVLQETMRLQSQGRDIWVPPLFSGSYVFQWHGDFPLRLSQITGFSIAASIIVTLAALWLLGASRFGLRWKACSQSLLLSALCGLDANKVARASFALAGALAGVTGWTSAVAYGGANSTVGLMIGFKAMFASVIGGFGSLRGAVFGAVTLAVLEVAWSAYFSTAYRDVAVFAVIILVLVLRPQGVFGIVADIESSEL